MRKIRKWKGGEKMKTLTKNKKRVDYVDNPFTEEQWDYISKELEQAKYEREKGIAEYCTVEEALNEMDEIIKEAKQNRRI